MYLNFVIFSFITVSMFFSQLGFILVIVWGKHDQLGMPFTQCLIAGVYASISYNSLVAIVHQTSIG